MKGRKPKPTVLHRLQGNPSKLNLLDRANEPEPPPFQNGDTPIELHGDTAAIREWKRLAPMLKKARQITDADRAALIAVCLEWSRYLSARRQSLPTIVNNRLNPMISIARHALAACLKLWPELGLTPSARTRVRIAAAEEIGGDSFSEFDNANTQPPPPAEPPETTH